MDNIYDEIEILKSLNHRHILRFFCTYDEYKFMYIVTELLLGGELFERIASKGNYTEKETRNACKVMFEAIAFCHEKKVVHRDLKPENLLLMSADNDSDLKIIDFGFAKYAKRDSLTTMCGTPCYLAPEIVRRSYYGDKVDMWSLGCIMYALLCGYLPFDDENLKRLFKKIYSGICSLDGKCWKNVSDSAKNLVLSLLRKNPDKRFSAKQALNHKWLMEEDDVLESRTLNKSLKNLLEFNSHRKKDRAIVHAGNNISGPIYYKMGQ